MPTDGADFDVGTAVYVPRPGAEEPAQLGGEGGVSEFHDRHCVCNYQ